MFIIVGVQLNTTTGINEYNFLENTRVKYAT